MFLRTDHNEAAAKALQGWPTVQKHAVYIQWPTKWTDKGSMDTSYCSRSEQNLHSFDEFKHPLLYQQMNKSNNIS